MNRHKMQLLVGSPASPYTRKMTALLRYRHIPYRLLLTEATEVNDLPRPKVRLLPTFYFPQVDGTLAPAVDSSPLIRRFEENNPERSVIPVDPALAFLDFLLEDFADEWLTKAMFHYRWRAQADIDKAGSVLPRWRSANPASDVDLAKWRKEFADRQISRLYVVGSNDVTAPVIEASYQRYLAAFNTHLEQHMFLFGARPSAADFGAHGQLTQLAKFDPTPAKLTEMTAPRVYAWVDMMEDLSGLTVTEEGWYPRAEMPDSLREILKEVGRGYVPVMLANAAALINGQTEVETEVEGQKWTQQAFPYQGKCLQWLREKFNALSTADQSFVADILADAECLPLVRPKR